jgi:hypothetical protein
MVGRFRLKALTSSTSVRVFRGERLELAVSGVGKARSAAAAGYLHGLGGGRRDEGWINVGIAGHRSLPLGEAVLAHRVLDRASGRSHYPSFAFKPPCPTETVVTVDRLEEGYPEGCALDMEASGFHEAAARFSSVELVHSLKIISDNEAAPPAEVTAQRAEALVESRLDLIATLIEEVASLAGELLLLEAAPPGLSEVLDRHHFTFSERHRLRRLLRRHRALCGGPPPIAAIARSRNARQALESLERLVEGLPPGDLAAGAAPVPPASAARGGGRCST